MLDQVRDEIEAQLPQRKANIAALEAELAGVLHIYSRGLHKNSGCLAKNRQRSTSADH